MDEEKDTTNVLKGFIRKYNTTKWLKKVHKHSSSLRVNSKSWRLFLKGTQKDLTDNLQKESVSREEKKNIRIAKRLMKNVASIETIFTLAK